MAPAFLSFFLFFNFFGGPGFSLLRWAFSSCGSQASRCGGFSCCGSRAIKCGLSSCSAQA